MKTRQKTHRKYFIQEYLQTAVVYHGGVGNKDIEKVLMKNRFQPILQPCHFDFSIKAKIFRVASVIKTILSLPVNSIVVFQWPLYAILNRVFVRLILKFRKDVKLICILTDVNGLKDDNEKTLSSELKFFKKIKFFVVHNDSMKVWLRQFNATAKISTLYFFDFLVDPPTRHNHKTDSIAFAGLLDKSKFIEDLDRLDGLKFHLYGPISIPVKTVKDVHYHGVLTNERLLWNLCGSFGLVWDGDSIEGLGGVFGKYNKYISPHKLSLYTAVGVPSIAHDLSGAASIIREHGIGFTVSSLFEIKEKISQLTEDDYQKMRKNCAQLTRRITSGNCLIEALSELGISGMHLND